MTNYSVDNINVDNSELFFGRDPYDIFTGNSITQWMPAGLITLRQTSHADRRLHPIDIEAATLGWMQLVVLAMESIVLRTLTMYVSIKMNFSSALKEYNTFISSMYYNNLDYMHHLPDNRGVKLYPALIIHVNMIIRRSRFPMVSGK